MVVLRDFLSQLNIFFFFLSALCVAWCMFGVLVLGTAMSVSAIGNHELFVPPLWFNRLPLPKQFLSCFVFLFLVWFSLDFDGYFHNELRSSCTAQYNFIVGTIHPTIGKLLCLICYNTTQRPYYTKVICFFFFVSSRNRCFVQIEMNLYADQLLLWFVICALFVLISPMKIFFLFLLLLLLVSSFLWYSERSEQFNRTFRVVEF